MAESTAEEIALRRLDAALDVRIDGIERESDYYTGVRPTIRLSDAAIPLYRQIVAQARTPWAQLVVDVAAERMEVTGFRVVTTDSADDDAEADSLAWDVWLSSSADVESQIAFQTMLLHGRVSVLVEATDDLPALSFEHPSTTAVLTAAGGRTTVAALKRWTDGDTRVAVLWTPDGAITYVRSARSKGWEVAEEQLAANTTGRVPVFEMKNRPDLLGGASSDLAGLYDTLDRAVQTGADRLTAQLYGATKVRYLIGVEPETDDDGNPTQRTLRMAVDKLVLIENPDAKAGVFPETDLRPIIEASRSDIAAIASISRLPVHLLSGDLTNLSAEALRSIMDGLAARVHQRQAWASTALSRAMRLSLQLAGDERVLDPRTKVEPIWADPLPQALSDQASAASTLVSGGVLSTTAAQEFALGLSPSQIDKFRQYERADALASQGVQAITGLFAAPQPAQPEQPTGVTA